ncbi:Lrp/AsnC family transcriptional regulator [Rubrivivax benzoatilyticus]|uniref:Lrp/AsnC family transcriptional regulator n=1 Tax=Rubrivivax benzoatilyticus TaxID=316997 RepID=A0ABX0HS89_9BURK|nr:Lrp/AsnC family transcriptional regulator [Rubrivivax benzoatilyticus]EGJ08754.1 putative transcriptional regulator [Rubrivivax benzoatilyticus JA2 = ATCC BAA-35]NHK97171.1 Lrp/AsnC family transcriptional regulator [Rubrivivax benzoatilyticus]NHL23134.1 Lrp/AsnC family transcriptional regulator [Rubrivivax benzoatilyticus]
MKPLPDETNTAAVALDALDLRLLDLLQDDATLPMRTLAARVGSSPATCQRRIAAMRASGVLLRQVAIVDRQRVGRPLTAFVSVELDRQNDALLRQFEQRMAAEPAVQACYEVSGEFDFLLVVTAASMQEYHAFTRAAFASHHNVRNFKSTFAMHCSKFETRVPLRPAASG